MLAEIRFVNTMRFAASRRFSLFKGPYLLRSMASDNLLLLLLFDNWIEIQYFSSPFLVGPLLRVWLRIFIMQLRHRFLFIVLLILWLILVEAVIDLVLDVALLGVFLVLQAELALFKFNFGGHPLVFSIWLLFLILVLYVACAFHSRNFWLYRLPLFNLIHFHLLFDLVLRLVSIVGSSRGCLSDVRSFNMLLPRLADTHAFRLGTCLFYNCLSLLPTVVCLAICSAIKGSVAMVLGIKVGVN